ncbi:MAG: NUDIX domain-containing protein [Microgenomates group bacterium]
MVKRKVSTEAEIAEIKEKYSKVGKVGVVVFICDLNGEVLVVKEKLSNPDTGKEVGSYAVLCETSESEEGWNETVMRGSKEELGIDIYQSDKLFKIDPKHCLLGESLFVEGVLARVAIIYYTRGKETLLSLVPESGEVVVAGWERPRELLSYPLRLGVRKILEECLQEGLLDRFKQFSDDSLVSLSVANLKMAEDNLLRKV